MTKTWFAAMTALTLMSGVAVAQNSETTTTTTETTSAAPVVPVVPVAPTSVVGMSRQRVIDQNGVVTEQTKSVSQGSALSPYGDTTTTRETTETHTVH